MKTVFAVYIYNFAQHVEDYEIDEVFTSNEEAQAHFKRRCAEAPSPRKFSGCVLEQTFKALIDNGVALRLGKIAKVLEKRGIPLA